MERTKRVPWNKGKTGIYSLAVRKKMSESAKKRGMSPKIGKGHKIWLGRKHTLETRKKIGDASRGAKCIFWRGGVSDMNNKIRHSLEYKLWRESVFQRDKYTCIWCGQKGGKLNADHIKPFALFPELRFAIDNGRTLCEECHKKTDTFGWKLSKKINQLNKSA
jgi:hypothetical protein